MYLTLPDRFTFAQFKQVTPIEPSNLVALIVERHDQRITVKRSAVAQENLRKIFESTFRLANKVGFAGMTLRDLCRDTGLSMGGLYGYIGSKDDLSAMIEDVIRFTSEAIPIWFSAQSSALKRLDSTLRGHIFISELLRPWFYFVFMESRTLSASQKTIARSSEMSFQDELSRLFVEAGLTDIPNAQLRAAHCMALIQDWYVKRWKYQQQQVSVDTFADSVCRLALLNLDALQDA
jgi:AcrR family transcriptional regulator